MCHKIRIIDIFMKAEIQGYLKGMKKKIYKKIKPTLKKVEKSMKQ